MTGRQTAGPHAAFSSGVPQTLTDDELRIKFPEHDFDGYWFFGGLRDAGEFHALMFGLSVGVNDGYDWGFRDVVPEADSGLYAFRAVGPEHSVGYAESGIHRHQFEYDRRRLDVRLANRASLAVRDDVLSCHLQSNDGALELDFEGDLGGIAAWTPDMVLRGTSWVTVAMPNVSFKGRLRRGGDVMPFSGVGTLDHPMGRNRWSKNSVGMGWWEYNAFMINDAFGLFQWKIVDKAGNLILNRAVTNFPDGVAHHGELELTYLDWQDRGSIHVPVRWRATITADHGVFEHEVSVHGPVWDGAPHQRGDALPNFALALNGVFRPAGGDAIDTFGRGTGETVISERDPFSDTPQKPW